MYITKLYLENFRNIKKQTLEFNKGINIFSGINAQGKTNIIEALWLFSSFKSFRTSSEKDFIEYDSDFADISMNYFSFGRNHESEIKYYKNRHREIFVNGIKMKPGEAIGKFTSVLFFPDHLNLIKQGPEERRRFTDFAICQINPIYFNILNNYNKILFQRNNLLKKDASSLCQTLDIWTEKMAEVGALIYVYRRKYIDLLQSYAVKTASEISSGKEKLTVKYKSFCEDIIDRKEAASFLYGKIKENEKKDILYGYSTTGVHKDDFDIFINGHKAKNFASQGQQRSAVMALKLAETEILKDVYGEYPVLLFDDVFSELDQERRNYITEKIRGKQVIVTSCEERFGADTDNVKHFEVSGGTVKEV